MKITRPEEDKPRQYSKDMVDRDGDFQRLMEQLAPGWSVSVDRVMPRWCDGHLAFLRCNPDEPISIEMIKELFGGRMLTVVVRDDAGVYRGSRTLKFPGPPRDGEGNELTPPRSESADPPAQNNFVGEQLAAMGKMFDTMLTNQRAQTTDLIAMMEKRIDSIEKSAATAVAAAAAPVEYEPEPQQNPLDNIRQLAETMRELEGLRSEMSARNPEAGSQDAGIMDTMVKEFFSLQLEKEKAKIQGMKNKNSGSPPPPLPERTRAAAPPAAPPVAAAPAAPQTERKDGNEERTPDAPENPRVHDLTDEELAIIVHQRLKKMPPEKMNAIFSIFAGQYDLVDDDGNIEPGDAPPDEYPDENGDDSGGNGHDDLRAT
jgi:hypothetical protein